MALFMETWAHLWSRVANLGSKKLILAQKRMLSYTVTIWWWGPQGDFLLWNYDIDFLNIPLYLNDLCAYSPASSASYSCKGFCKLTLIQKPLDEYEADDEAWRNLYKGVSNMEKRWLVTISHTLSQKTGFKSQQKNIKNQ